MFTTIKGNFDYDARLEQLDQRVRDKLNNYIILSTQHNPFIALNFYKKRKHEKKCRLKSTSFIFLSCESSNTNSIKRTSLSNIKYDYVFVTICRLFIRTFMLSR